MTTAQIAPNAVDDAVLGSFDLMSDPDDRIEGRLMEPAEPCARCTPHTDRPEATMGEGAMTYTMRHYTRDELLSLADTDEVRHTVDSWLTQGYDVVVLGSPDAPGRYSFLRAGNGAQLTVKQWEIARDGMVAPRRAIGYALRRGTPESGVYPVPPNELDGPIAAGVYVDFMGRRVEIRGETSDHGGTLPRTPKLVWATNGNHYRQSDGAWKYRDTFSKHRPENLCRKHL